MEGHVVPQGTHVVAVIPTGASQVFVVVRYMLRLLVFWCHSPISQLSRGPTGAHVEPMFQAPGDDVIGADRPPLMESVCCGWAFSSRLCHAMWTPWGSCGGNGLGRAG
jgi:hypothetical protein